MYIIVLPENIEKLAKHLGVDFTDVMYTKSIEDLRTGLKGIPSDSITRVSELSRSMTCLLNTYVKIDNVIKDNDTDVSNGVLSTTIETGPGVRVVVVRVTTALSDQLHSGSDFAKGIVLQNVAQVLTDSHIEVSRYTWGNLLLRAA
jgi:hypothetical protein